MRDYTDQSTMYTLPSAQLGLQLIGARLRFGPTLPETNMETQKGPYKDYSSSKRGLYGFPC